MTTAPIALTPALFHGQTAVVSGAGSGIGRAVAVALAERGAQVAALDWNPATLDVLETEGHARGLSIRPYVCDVARPDALSHTVNALHEDLGTPHLLANVAGLLRLAPASSVALSDWEEVFRVNATGVMLLSQAVVRLMIPECRGAIVTVASNAGTTPRIAMCAYSASKAAATMYARCLGLEVAKYNIRCNVVSPGSTSTPMLSEMLGGDEQKALTGSAEHFRLGIPLGRVADVNDVAAAVLFLLSSQARHITLHNLVVDGGATLGC